MRKPIAKEYLELTNKWHETDSEIIAKNVEKYLVEIYPECNVRSTMYKKLSKITGSSVHTAYAWMNKSRNGIKVPLDKLCFIAVTFKKDIRLFLTEDENEEICD